MKKNAFTLIELVLVIVILVILGTIALINFKWATLSARDSVRISDVTNISNGLFLYNTKSWDFPIPENSISVTYWWIEFSKIWNLSKSSLSNLWLSWDLIDPMTKKPYPYTLTADNKVLVASKLESDSSLHFDSANASVDEFFVKWNAKYLYLTSDFSIPSNNIELKSTSDSKNYLLINQKSNWIKWNLSSLRWGVFSSCNNVNRLLPWASTWKFDIMLNGKNKSVYCDSGWMRSHLLKSDTLTSGITNSEAQRTSYDNLFKLDKEFNSGAYYTTNIKDISFSKYRYATWNSLSDVDNFSDPIVMYWNYNEWFDDWINSYDKHYAESITLPSSNRPNYFFYNSIWERNKVTLCNYASKKWWRNMYSERLLCWIIVNKYNGNWRNATVMPFWKRGLTWLWCVWGDNWCTPNPVYPSADIKSWMKSYASLWIK